MDRNPYPTAFLWLAVLGLGAAACSSIKEGGDPPDGVTCGSTVNGGGDAASLSSALAAAGPGTCVLVVSQTYSGHFVVPAGVTLASARGSRAVFAGDTKDPVIDLAGGGGGLADVDVTSPPGIGVAVRSGGATLADVAVSGAKKAGIAVRCTGGGCADDGAVVTLKDVHVTGGALGVWVSGARLAVDGGEVSNQAGETLTGGMGLVAVSGAHVTANGVVVDGNAATGILIDGEGGTTAALTDARVTHNGARGIWVQRTQGTIDAPSLRIDGAATNIEANSIVGVGGADAHGIIIVGGRIAGTADAPVVTNLSSTEQVGDGLGVFSGSGDVRLDGVELSGNARAAALLDGATGSIIIVGGKVAAGASNLKVVVQGSTGAQLDVPTDATSTSAVPLGVSAPIVSVGEVLP